MTSVDSGASWQVDSTTAVSSYSIQHPAPASSTGFPQLIQTPSTSLNRRQNATSSAGSDTSLSASAASNTASPPDSTLVDSSTAPAPAVTPSSNGTADVTSTTIPSAGISNSSSAEMIPLETTSTPITATQASHAQETTLLSVPPSTSPNGTLTSSGPGTPRFGGPSDPGNTGIGSTRVTAPRTSHTSTTAATTGPSTDTQPQSFASSQTIITGSVVGGVLASVFAAVVFFLVWRQRRLGRGSRKPWLHFLRRVMHLPRDVGAKMFRDPESAPNTVPVPWTSPYSQGTPVPYQDYGRFSKGNRPGCWVTQQWRAMNPAAASSLERITQLTSELETEVEVLNRVTRLEVRPNDNGHPSPLLVESPALSPVSIGSNTISTSPASSRSDLSYVSQQQQLLNVRTNIMELDHGPRETPPPLYQE
ncbi:hypothetical protein P691DRAFT_756600 [Macrolepiota fuliginosa MF-IS2]|uniref:Uncharacterized protein n=1 Tax=Macrolepiota fuliginosa MF-IS2 TaxID=1400762 RepID=A0A9P5XK20_9AGAR|nr:hypothetical protein P691DRAFT_756600 [Macrolepiota fuliginosa MF-IS2]